MKSPGKTSNAGATVGTAQRQRKAETTELAKTLSRSKAASSKSKASPAKRKSAASDIAASTDRRSRASSVVAFSRRTRVEKTKKNGKSQLLARFPIPLEEDQEVDLTFLLDLPNFWEMIAEGFRIWGAGVERTSRYGRATLLRLGIASYLRENCPTATPIELGCHWTAFKTWLDRYSIGEGAVLNPTTCRERYGAIRPLLQCLLDHPVWAGVAGRVLDEYPINQYPDVGRHSQPRQRLPREVLERIDAAAQRDILQIRQRFDEGEKLIQEGSHLLAQGSDDYKNFAVLLARIVQLYPGLIPDQREVRSLDSRLGHWLYLPESRGGHGVTKAGSYLYASASDLVPFVVLLTIDALLNPDSVLGMTWSMISEWERAGEPCYRITASKPRAGHDPSKFVDPALYTNWITTLKRITARICPVLPQAGRDKVFVFAQLWGRARRGGYFSHANTGGPSNDAAWKLALKKFQQKHGLPRFTLSQLRPTGADEIGIRWGSQVAQIALEHEDWRTTERSYAKSGTRDRERESLGTVIQTYERFIATSGKSDVRRVRVTPSMDKGAATPGYTCLDPYDSPRPGQRKERLCSAYGECPACPLAGFNPEDPVAAANGLALRKAIYDAQRDVAPQAWVVRWAPVLRNLEAQLSVVPDQVARQALLFKVRLPVVG